MTIKERVKKALDKNKVFIETDPRQLSGFVEDLKKSGLVIKKEYDLPPLDTVGRQIYQERRDSGNVTEHNYPVSPRC